jgi:hypothetical protein
MPGIMGKAFGKRGRAWRKHSGRRGEREAPSDDISHQESSPGGEHDSYASARELWSAESSLSGVTEELSGYNEDEDESLSFYASREIEGHDSMLAMIIYQRPPPPPLQDSVELWCKC